MSAFLIRRGKAAVRRRRKAHLAHYDAHGQIDRAWCGRTEFDLTSNVPWGLGICKTCAKEAGQ